MVKPKEISVVVQGPIVGKRDWPQSKRLTERALDSIRRFLPGAEIILSTWAGSQVDGLSFDRLVESQDPGGLLLHEHKGKKLFFNCSRQIVSAREGLRVATRPYAVKFRTDMVFESAGFLDYFGRYPQRASEWAVFRERVVVGTMFSRDPARLFPQPFCPSDWFAFGRREDVLDLWDVPLVPEEYCTWFQNRPRPANRWNDSDLRYAPEQYLWLGFLRKHAEVPCEHQWDYGPHNARIHELTFANNLIIASARQLGFRFLKYGFGFVNAVSVYDHAGWQELYARHCDPAFTPRLTVTGRMKRLAARFLKWQRWLLPPIEKLEYHFLKWTALQLPK